MLLHRFSVQADDKNTYSELMVIKPVTHLNYSCLNIFTIINIITKPCLYGNSMRSQPWTKIKVLYPMIDMDNRRLALCEYSQIWIDF